MNYIIEDLDESVVDDAGADVDDVEDGERHQQVVERRSHLGLPEVKTKIKVLNNTKPLKLPGSSTSSLVPLLSRQVSLEHHLIRSRMLPRFYQY